MYLGSANENSTVPNILNHLLTKPEMREEDFFKQDIYSSPKFRLDKSRCHESVIYNWTMVNCRHGVAENGSTLHGYVGDGADQEDIHRYWRLPHRLQKASEREGWVKEAGGDKACIVGETQIKDHDAEERYNAALKEIRI